MLARIWSYRDLHSLLEEMKNGTATVEDRLEVSFKININLYLTQQPHSSTITPWTENLYSYKNLCTKVDSSFIHILQLLDATKMSFRRIHTLWCIQTMESYLALNDRVIKSHEGFLNAYCEVKEANLKKQCSLWFQLCDFRDILEKSKPIIY